MYQEIEKSDYIIVTLGTNNKDAKIFKTLKCSGSVQLGYGFNKPMLIHEDYAALYNLTNTNSFLFNDENFVHVFKKAIKLTDKEYRDKQINLNKTANEVYNLSLKNLKNSLNLKADKNEDTDLQFNNNNILINSWVKFDKKGNLLPNNWGDDINFKFLNEIFEENFVYNNYKGRYTNYNLIGSIISNNFIFNNTIIWGSGTQDDKGQLLKIKPKKVLAVRGPLTRKFLINQGIECPEIYGDPAVLLPQFYKPEIIKTKYEIGFIPHIYSLNSNIVKTFVKDKRVHLIRLRGYQHWLDIIDEILACRYIVSESLHGLIISESYGIPNLWGKITLNKNNIKFHDWFLSIGVDRENPYIIKNDTKVDDIIHAMKNYKKGNPIDIDKLMSVCPFKLKETKNIKISRN